MLEKYTIDQNTGKYDAVINWKHFPRYWPFVSGNYRSPVVSPRKRQWRRVLIFFFDLCLNKRLSKQSRPRWFETPLHWLWLQCNNDPFHIWFMGSYKFVETVRALVCILMVQSDHNFVHIITCLQQNISIIPANIKLTVHCWSYAYRFLLSCFISFEWTLSWVDVM